MKWYIINSIEIKVYKFQSFRKQVHYSHIVRKELYVKVHNRTHEMCLPLVYPKDKKWEERWITVYVYYPALYDRLILRFKVDNSPFP